MCNYYDNVWVYDKDIIPQEFVSYLPTVQVELLAGQIFGNLLK